MEPHSTVFNHRELKAMLDETVIELFNRGW